MRSFPARTSCLGAALTLGVGCTSFNDEPPRPVVETPKDVRTPAMPGPRSASPTAAGNPSEPLVAPATPPAFTTIPANTVWAKGSVHPIRWTLPSNYLPLDPWVELVQSIDSGATWKTLAEGFLKDRYYRWTMPRDGDRVRFGMELHLTSSTGVVTPKGRIETADVGLGAAQDKEYDWVSVTPNAPFGPRDGAGGVVFNGKMWLLGGWNPLRFPLQTANDVWSSVDGANWVMEKPNTFLDASTFPATDWEGRHFAGYQVFDGKMWIVGGDPNQGYYQSDVWSSTNGQTWTRTDRHSVVPRVDVATGLPYPDGQFRPVEIADYGLRGAHVTGTFLNQLFVMGGQRVSDFVNPIWPGAPAKAFNDVWWSTDGATFRELTTTGTIWRPRGYVSDAVEHRSRMWIVGGGLSEDTVSGVPEREYFNDVWSTSDGAAWSSMPTEAPFSARIWHNVKSFDGRLWLINGYDGYKPGQGRLGDNLGDVWYSTDGANWYEASPPSSFVPRHAGTAWVYNGALYVGSGNAIRGDWYADVWKMTPRPLP